MKQQISEFLQFHPGRASNPVEAAFQSATATRPAPAAPPRSGVDAAFASATGVGKSYAPPAPAPRRDPVNEAFASAVSGAQRGRPDPVEAAFASATSGQDELAPAGEYDEEDDD